MSSNIRTCAKCKEEKECPYGKSYCRPCQALSCREYKARNKEKIAEYNKKYKAEHKEEISDYNQKYNKENREVIQQRQNKQHRTRRENDYNYKRACTLRSRLLEFIKKGTRSKVVSCNRDFFIKWLQFNFKEDMNMENRGDIWCIDHVLPCSYFNLENDEEEKKCFHWTNLRPLYVKDNLKRQNKVTTEDILAHEDLIKEFIEKNKEDSIHIIIYDKLAYLNKQ